MTAEEINGLLARGDALLSMADVTSSRLFYERAAAAGDAQAALRLAATYDPSFLAQAGFKGVGGALAAAHYWYQRARDLGSDADIASFGQQIESARAAEQVVTVSPAQPVTEPGTITEPGTTGLARSESTDLRSQSVMTGEPTRQAALGVHRQVTGGPRPAHGRHTGIQRPQTAKGAPIPVIA
jgi:TPR repeat protein